jgi:hypothetical protein
MAGPLLFWLCLFACSIKGMRRLFRLSTLLKELVVALLLEPMLLLDFREVALSDVIAEKMHISVPNDEPVKAY